MFFDRFRERDFDREGRGDCVVSMSSFTSEDKYWNLFPVSTGFELSLTICLLLLFLLFPDEDDDFVDELLRILLFPLPLDSLPCDVSPVPEPVDAV